MKPTTLCTLNFPELKDFLSDCPNGGVCDRSHVHGSLRGLNRLGKWKTASQMVAIALLLVAPGLASLAAQLQQAGDAALWLAALLSWLSAGLYLRAVLRHGTASKAPRA